MSLGSVSIGSIALNVSANLQNIRNQLQQFRQQNQNLPLSFRADIKEVQKQINSLGNKAMVGLTLPIGLAFKESINEAKSAIEDENFFKVSFGALESQARESSKKIKADMGVSEYETRKSMGIYNQMLTQMGVTKEESLKMSAELTKSIYDGASFYNKSTDEMFGKLKAGISGEIEPLKELGIIMNDDILKDFAVKQGIIKKIEKTDSKGNVKKDTFGNVQYEMEQLKGQKLVDARYQFIMSQMKNAQGDMNRSDASGSLDVKLKKTEQQLKDIKIEVGQKFIPVLLQLMQVVKQVLDWWTGLNDKTKDLIIKLGLVLMVVGPILKTISTGIAIFNTLKTVITTVKGAFAVLNVVMTANPIGLIVVAIGILIAIIWKFRQQIWEVLKPVLEKLKPIFEMIGKVIYNAFIKYIEWSINSLKWLINIIKNVFEWLSNLFQKLWNSPLVFATFLAPIKVAIEVFKWLKEGISNGTISWQNFKQFMADHTFIDEIANAFKFVIEAIKEAIHWIGNFLDKFNIFKKSKGEAENEESNMSSYNKTNNITINNNINKNMDSDNYNRQMMANIYRI